MTFLREMDLLLPGRVWSVSTEDVSWTEKGLQDYPFVILPLLEPWRYPKLQPPISRELAESYVRGGGTLVVSLQVYAHYFGLEVCEDRAPEVTYEAQGVFPGPDGKYEIAVHYGDAGDQTGSFILYLNGVKSDIWSCVHPAGKTPVWLDRPVQVPQWFGPSQIVDMKQGDVIRLVGVLDGGSARMDRIVFTPKETGVEPVVMGAESLSLSGVYEVERNCLGSAASVRVAQSVKPLTEMPGIEIVEESDVTCGLVKGQVAPWWGSDRAHRGLSSLPEGDVRVLGRSTISGRPMLVEHRLGRGRVVVMDLVLDAAPGYRSPGGDFKYQYITKRG